MSISRRDVLRGILGGAALAGCGTPAASGDGEDTDLALPDVSLDKKPWVTIVSPTSMRLRFETMADVEVGVWLSGPDGKARAFTPTRDAAELVYENPTLSDAIPADVPGQHVRHEVILDGLVPGETYAWRVPTLSETHEGAFRCPPASDAPVRLGWMADSMWPNTDATLAVLSAQSPDVVMHGGDLQYSSNPSDTWSGFFASLVPVTSLAPLQVAIGNHELEKETELLEMFDRLFGEQGDSGPGYTHAFRAGSALVLMLDSETFSLSDDTSEQYAWLDAQLAAADADDTVKAVILGWHRPLFTFSEHYHPDRVDEDVMLPHLLGHKVRLILGGHSHSYEHFQLYGMDWVVDGAAGALLYNVDFKLPDATVARPDVVAARKFAEAEFGCTTVDVAPDGSMVVRRLHASDGAEVYRFQIAAAG